MFAELFLFEANSYQVNLDGLLFELAFVLKNTIERTYIQFDQEDLYLSNNATSVIVKDRRLKIKETAE